MMSIYYYDVCYYTLIETFEVVAESEEKALKELRYALSTMHVEWIKPNEELKTIPAPTTFNPEFEVSIKRWYDPKKRYCFHLEVSYYKHIETLKIVSNSVENAILEAKKELKNRKYEDIEVSDYHTTECK